AYPAPAAMPSAKPPGPSLRLSLILTILGAAIAIPSFIAFIVPLVNTLSSSSRYSVPSTISTHLGSGEYLIYEDTGSSGFGKTGDPNSVTLRPSDVTITGSDGSTVRPYEPGAVVESLPRGGREYTGAVAFTTPTSDEYRIRISSPSSTTVLIARPL